MKVEKDMDLKKVVARNEDERDVWVCIATQKLGLASVADICEKIDGMGGRISEKQVAGSAEKLRMRGLLSIDLSEKDTNGISIKKYKMKSIKLSIPEVAQIKDVVDNADVKPLLDELDRSKKTMKKGVRTFDYYVAEVTFKTEGLVQGFMQNSDEIIQHYRDAEGNIVLYAYHFQNWFRDNLPLINRASSTTGVMKFTDGKVTLSGPCVILEKMVVNVQSGFSGSQGTAGRGSKKIECLPPGTVVKTAFVIQRDTVSPDKVERMLTIFGKYGSGFGGGHKLSTGRLIPEKVCIVNEELFGQEE